MHQRTCSTNNGRRKTATKNPSYSCPNCFAVARAHSFNCYIHILYKNTSFGIASLPTVDTGVGKEIQYHKRLSSSSSPLFHPFSFTMLWRICTENWIHLFYVGTEFAVVLAFCCEANVSIAITDGANEATFGNKAILCAFVQRFHNRPNHELVH